MNSETLCINRETNHIFGLGKTYWKTFYMLTLHVLFFEGGGKCALHNETLDTYKL